MIPISHCFILPLWSITPRLLPNDTVTYALIDVKQDNNNNGIAKNLIWQRLRLKNWFRIIEKSEEIYMGYVLWKQKMGVLN